MLEYSKNTAMSGSWVMMAALGGSVSTINENLTYIGP